jgi:indole-3-glycerol phosphate synthase
LKTLKVDINNTRRILEKIDSKGRMVVSESGIKTPSDLRLLYAVGTKAFLIGSAIMLADDIKKKVEEFVWAV